MDGQLRFASLGWRCATWGLSALGAAAAVLLATEGDATLGALEGALLGGLAGAAAAERRALRRAVRR
jgi:hypothetical protein